MNLSTKYLGFDLPHPIVPGASPLVDDLDTVRRLEDAGAPMIVMHSLFEEQLTREQMTSLYASELYGESFSEASSFLPDPDEFQLGPDQYLAQIARLKQAVKIPILGSLNGTTEGGWLRYATLIEQAGADAIELNLYEVPTDPSVPGSEIEERQLRLVRVVKESVQIPVAIKISSMYSSIPHFAHRLDQAGADALVLFNRFYQPDIDPVTQELKRVNLSSPEELPLRLRWTGILSGRLKADLAVTGGVHSAIDVVKAVMAGAHCTQMVSALLHRGPGHLSFVRKELSQWLEQNQFESLQQLQGSMSLERCADPSAYERANYIRVLQSWNSK